MIDYKLGVDRGGWGGLTKSIESDKLQNSGKMGVGARWEAMAKETSIGGCCWELKYLTALLDHGEGEAGLGLESISIWRYTDDEDESRY